MNTMLESLSSKIEELSVAEKNRENTLEFMRNTLHKEQNGFKNYSFDLILENFRLSSNRSVQELSMKQHKGYEALMEMEKRTIVAFSAYTTKTQTITLSTNVKFEKVWTNIGNEYDPSTGIFTAPRQSVYHISTVVMSLSGKQLYPHVKHNNKYTAGSLVSGDGRRLVHSMLCLAYRKTTLYLLDVKEGTMCIVTVTNILHFLDILSHNQIPAYKAKWFHLFSWALFMQFVSQFE
ncbi:unnamed protein product [Mytilus coruscus]|uniref:C1q domain-containing protein n=1 Tax=Mytilus coruscus TaxID=42192 RepID=A0A6J8CTF6_MYTCO|nr:unnamed protein product [Mytilus coruscus]